RVHQAKGALDQSIAAREKAHLDFERGRRLYESKSLTKADFDALSAAVQGADAQAEAAHAQAEEAEIAHRDASLRSPMDGLVLEREIEIGTLVGPGSVAFMLADVRSVKVIFGVPDTTVGHLSAGESVTVQTESIPGSKFAGTI